MPRKPGRGSHLSQKERTEIAALMLEGEKKSAIARKYDIRREAVERLARRMGEIDMTQVAAIKSGLPSLMSILAAAHATEALERAHSDPATAVKSTFGAKLALESNRLSSPMADSPGKVMMNFISQLDVNLTPQPQPQVVDLVPEEEMRNGSEISSG